DKLTGESAIAESLATSEESTGANMTSVDDTPAQTLKPKDNVEDRPISSPSSVEESSGIPSLAGKVPEGVDPEIMVRAGVRKILIRREEREFGLEVLEHL
ncbi:hypothetical protein BGZ65_005195, partial [Modicella reniformis]